MCRSSQAETTLTSDAAGSAEAVAAATAIEETAERITHVTFHPKNGRMILTTESKSGNYERYIKDEWIIDPALKIESYFDRCKDALENPRYSKEGSGRPSHKIRIPQGCRRPRQAHDTSPSLMPAAFFAEITSGPAGPPIQSSNTHASNCMLAALANGLLEADPDADPAELQQMIFGTEQERSVALGQTSELAKQLSNGHIVTSAPKKFLKGTELTRTSVNWTTFFQSDHDASFGVFVVEIESMDGSMHEHVICLVRKREEGASYLVDGNPKFGKCRWPLTAASLAKLEVKSITHAVKLVHRLR